MRQIVLDTETTGLEARRGHRVIEIGCVELAGRRPSGRRFHHYLNPDRDIDDGAFAVHGISNEFLRDKPRFADIAAEFLEFVADAEIIAHNAAFDIGFLEAELEVAGLAPGCLRERAQVLDTLVLAREKYPGQRNNLDALCRRLGVDASQRELHGALLDAQLLAEVYLAMTAGQGDLALPDFGEPGLATGAAITRTDIRIRIITATAAEQAAHRLRLEQIDAASRDGALWLRTSGNEDSAQETLLSAQSLNSSAPVSR